MSPFSTPMKTSFQIPAKVCSSTTPVAACTEFKHPEAQGCDRNPTGRPFHLDLTGGLRVPFRTNTGHADRTQRCASRWGDGRFGDVPDSASRPRPESAHAQGGPREGSPRQDPIPAELCRGRAAPGRGRGLGRPRPGRAQARGCPAAPRFRRAPPRPASCGLVRHRCHVGLCGSRRRRRRQRSGGAASLAQPPECEDNDHPGRAGSFPVGTRSQGARRQLLPSASARRRSGGMLRL